MKKILLFAIFNLLLLVITNAQNVGIGTNTPTNKLQVSGSLLVNQPYSQPVNAPTPTQTQTMVNASTINFTSGDSTGRIYDPAGPTGNYIANLTATCNIYSSLTYPIGIEIQIESIELGAFDSLILQNFNGSILLAVGNNYTTPGNYIYNTNGVILIFKSNNDASTGQGFSVFFRNIYNNDVANSKVNDFVGNALFFDTKKGAFRSGRLSTGGIGNHSTAMGYNTIASGNISTAIGANTIASGSNSTAMGFLSSASGTNSTAMGYNTTASGDNSTAMGYETIASGVYSTAMGRDASTNGKTRSFAINGGSGGAINNTEHYQMMMYFDTYTLYSGASGQGVGLPTNGNSWVSHCDRRKKENFLLLSGEEVLQKISAIEYSSWNYKNCDRRNDRHYGVMAQDFYKAFGQDSYGNIGNDTTVNPIDMIGINMAAIKALANRTDKIEELQQQNATLQRENLILNNKLAQVSASLHELEKQVNAIVQSNKIKHPKEDMVVVSP